MLRYLKIQIRHLHIVQMFFCICSSSFTQWCLHEVFERCEQSLPRRWWNFISGACKLRWWSGPSALSVIMFIAAWWTKWYVLCSRQTVSVKIIDLHQGMEELLRSKPHHQSESRVEPCSIQFMGCIKRVFGCLFSIDMLWFQTKSECICFFLWTATVRTRSGMQTCFLHNHCAKFLVDSHRPHYFGTVRMFCVKSYCSVSCGHSPSAIFFPLWTFPVHANVLIRRSTLPRFPSR